MSSPSLLHKIFLTITLPSLLLSPTLALALPSPFPAPAPTLSPPSDTRNDILLSHCRPLTLLYARGTSSPGNLGLSPSVELITAIERLLPNGSEDLAVQGVMHYPASPEDVEQMDGSESAALNMVYLTGWWRGRCERTKMVWGGGIVRVRR